MMRQYCNGAYSQLRPVRPYEIIIELLGGTSGVTIDIDDIIFIWLRSIQNFLEHADASSVILHRDRAIDDAFVI